MLLRNVIGIFVATCLVPTVMGTVSDKFEAGIITKKVALGKPLTLRCKVSSGYDMCRFVAPDQGIFNVNGETVTDDKGMSVAGVEIDTSEANTCSITVNELQEQQIGKWSCKLSNSDKETFHEGFLNAITEVRVKDVRLPNVWNPDKYDVQIIVSFVPEEFNVTGEVKVYLTAEEEDDTDRVVLHAKAMTIHESLVVVLNEKTNEIIPVKGFGYDEDRDFFIVYLNKAVGKGANISVSLKYSAPFKNDLSGIYWSTFDRDGEKQYMAMTQFQAVDARKAFPCMDEPDKKAVFQLSLGRPRHFTAVSNMPLKQEGLPIEGNPNYVMDIFEPSKKMSTYLLAFLISDFQPRISKTKSGVEFRIWSRNETYEQTELASRIGPQILDMYEKKFGIDFPLPKQDMAAIIELNYGAMENWGLITYLESALLYEPGVSSKADKEKVSRIVSHELAHMWFGNLVTMKWWNDLWLNEGFASFMEYQGIDLVEPESGALDRFVVQSTQKAFKLDALDTSHPIQAEVHHPDDISEIFDTISYLKGSSLVRMITHFLGSDTFFKGVKRYFTKFQYNNAVQDDLWMLLTEAAHEDGSLYPNQTVTDIMNEWTLKKGYPVITVGQRQENTVSLDQAKFSISGGASEAAKENTKWWVPISYSYAGGDFANTKNKLWLSPEDDGPIDLTVEAPQDAALIVNVQEVGYYRVNYHNDNWLAIANALEKNVSSIHRANRAQIVDDAFNLAKASLLDYNTAFRVTKFLSNETDFIPWSAAQNVFSYIQLMMKNTPDYSLLKDYLGKLIKVNFEKLGFEGPSDEGYLDAQLRDIAVAYQCKFEQAACTDKVKHDFATWMNSSNPDLDTENPFNAGLRTTLYCTAIALGTSKEWNFLKERHDVAINENVKRNIKSALGCTKDIDILKKYLTLAFATDTKRTDSEQIVKAMSQTTEGAFLASDYVSKNWLSSIERFDTTGGPFLRRMVDSTTKGFNTVEQLEAVEAWAKQYEGRLGTAKGNVETAILNMKANVEWMKTHAETIGNFLKAGKDETTF
jgi:aminopeptidase N